MKQPHTEEAIEHTDGQQDTGNHKKPDAPDAKGADRFGGTRAGTANVEPGQGAETSGGVTGTGHAAREAERDERGPA